MANIADHLFEQAKARGDKLALVYEGRNYTFSEIAEQVRIVAGGLSHAGVGVGSRVGLMMNSQPEFIFFEQAVFALGGVLSPLNIFYKRSEILHAISSCDLEFMIIGREFVDSLTALGDVGTESLRLVIALDLDVAKESRTIQSADQIARSGKRIEAPVSLSGEAIALMLNTSATTGKAKGVMLSIDNIRANYDPTPQWLGLDADTVILATLPLYNTFGLNQCINALMVTGGTMVLMQRFDAGRCLEAIEKYRCTFFPAVPTMLQKIFDHPEAATSDLSSIKRIMTGAAPVPAALLERIYAAMGRDTVVMTGYGLTEGTAIVALEHIELDADGRVRRPKSIGRALPGIELRVETVDGREAVPGEVGEICIRGPNVMSGYYKSPEQTALAIVGGWLRTGDLGLVDSGGFTYIVDRKKDVIIRGGQNIYPADIEEVIYHCSGVGEVAVVAAPDGRFGEVPVAFVAPRLGATISEDAILAKCREELAYYKVPAAIHVLPELPKGPTGKILRRELRAAPDAGFGATGATSTAEI